LGSWAVWRATGYRWSRVAGTAGNTTSRDQKCARSVLSATTSGHEGATSTQHATSLYSIIALGTLRGDGEESTGR
jgi:hypothetical protein